MAKHQIVEWYCTPFLQSQTSNIFDFRSTRWSLCKVIFFCHELLEFLENQHNCKQVSYHSFTNYYIIIIIHKVTVSQAFWPTGSGKKALIPWNEMTFCWIQIMIRSVGQCWTVKWTELVQSSCDSQNPVREAPEFQPENEYGGIPFTPKPVTWRKQSINRTY